MPLIESAPVGRVRVRVGVRVRVRVGGSGSVSVRFRVSVKGRVAHLQAGLQGCHV